jgi:hypothetical protein
LIRKDLGLHSEIHYKLYIDDPAICKSPTPDSPGKALQRGVLGADNIADYRMAEGKNKTDIKSRKTT